MFWVIHGPKPQKFKGFRWAFISQTPVSVQVDTGHETTLRAGGVPVTGGRFKTKKACAKTALLAETP